jgi:putative ABC transport system permease protein
MSLSETFNSALTALKSNITRTILTMLGVVIGVFAVVALVATIKGFQNYITDQFSALGTNLILVIPGKGFSGDPSVSYSNNKLATKHVNLIQTFAGQYIDAISPAIRVGKTVYYRTKNYYTTIGGGYVNVQNIVGLEMDKGRFYNEAERRGNAHVAVIGPKIVAELFGSRNPIGENIKIDTDTFKVIGVFKSKGPNFDDRVFVPDTTMTEAFGINAISSISIKAKDGYDLDFVAEQVRFALLRDLKKDEFSVMSEKDLLSSVQSILGILSTVLAAIAGISLLVGGIGIMNIMLVSVNERIREIGLRKALGATSFNIALQFVLESMLISLIGGLVGLGFGYGATFIVRFFLRAEVPWWAAVLGVVFSIIVGVAFGTYPALQASKKDPIEALRYE